jgi:hypothetical protein
MVDLGTKSAGSLPAPPVRARSAPVEHELSALPRLWLFPTSKGLILVQNFVWILVWIIAETHPGYTLELPDRKARGFLVLIALKRLFPEHTHRVFGEMSVRT